MSEQTELSEEELYRLVALFEILIQTELRQNQPNRQTNEKS